MRMLSHRIRLALWSLAWEIARPFCRPWLWYGRFESEHVINWYLETFAANAYHHEAYINGDWR